MMIQCLMEKTSENSRHQHLAWIPEKFAVQGKIVKIKDDTGEWDDGWCVKSVFLHSAMEDKAQAKLSRQWKHHREVTDI